MHQWSVMLPTSARVAQRCMSHSLAFNTRCCAGQRTANGILALPRSEKIVRLLLDCTSSTGHTMTTGMMPLRTAGAHCCGQQVFRELAPQ